MNYVRCINNKAYLHVPDEAVNGALMDLTIGAVYKVLPTPQQERDTGLLRIIDNSGEDYLYPASYFQPLDWHTLPAEEESGHAALTIHLDPRTKAILRAEALAAHTSMGALVRQWIEERLELQSRREATR
jgi:Ribbon-helix-helix protein, copG family